MDSAGSQPGRLSYFLGGLQAGMVGAFFSAFWLALGSTFTGRGFWGAANSMATALTGGIYHRGFHFVSIAGLALHLMVYSLLGGVIAVALREEIPRVRRTLSCIVLSLAWFYVCYGLVWPHLAPMVVRVQPFSMAVVGHMIYGGLLSRYAAYARDLAGWVSGRNPAPEPGLGPETAPLSPLPQADAAPDAEIRGV